MKSFVLFGLLAIVPVFECSAIQVASPGYVESKIESKVDISADANQTLNGTYTVSDDGMLNVPTPQLPSAD